MLRHRPIPLNQSADTRDMLAAESDEARLSAGSSWRSPSAFPTLPEHDAGLADDRRARPILRRRRIVANASHDAFSWAARARVVVAAHGENQRQRTQHDRQPGKPEGRLRGHYAPFAIACSIAFLTRSSRSSRLKACV